MNREDYLKVEMKYHLKSATVISVMGVAMVLLLLAFVQMLSLTNPSLLVGMFVVISMIFALVGVECFLANRSLMELRRTVKRK